MNLKEYAKEKGITYQTASIWYKSGKLDFLQISKPIHKNFGKKRTPEQIERNRQIQLDRYKDPKEREIMRQACLGKKLTSENKEKLRLASIGRIKSPKEIEKIRIGNIGKKDTPETREKKSQSRKGSKNPAWCGGISFKPYCYKFNEPLKRSVRIRDNHTCQLCEQKQIKELSSVHHIHYDKENCYPDLICLCRSCNAKVNKKSLRSYYESLFMNKLNDRQLLFWTRRIEEK